MRLLFSIPLTLVPLIVYAVLVMGPGGVAAFDSVLISQAMLSGGTVTVTQGHTVAAIAIIALFLEVVKATRTGFAPVLDHVLSVITAMGALVLFIVWAPAASGLFALLVLVALIDVLAGFWISLNVARRDVAISPGGSF